MSGSPRTEAHAPANVTAPAGGAVLLAVLDRRGRLADVNDAFCRAVGFRREELAGHSTRRLRSDVHPPAFWRDLRRTLASGRSWQGEICHRVSDGSHVWIEATITPDLDARGVPQRFVAACVNVSERRQLADATSGLTAAGAATTPREFLGRIAESLAEVLGASGVVIAEEEESGSRLRSVAAVVHGRREDEFTLEVADTPFESLLHGDDTWDACSGRAVENLAAETLFPGAPERLVSVRLANPAGDILGVLSVLDPPDGRTPESLLPVLRLYAERVSAKLDRLREDRGLRRLTRAIDAAGEAILLADVGGRAVYANDAFTWVTGFSPEEARHVDVLAALTAGADEDVRVRLWQSLSDGEPWKGMLVCRHRSGADFHAAISVAPTQHETGETSGVVVVLRDVSEMAERELALRRQNESLHVVNRELSLARDGAEAASRAKSEFLGSISQDLRTSMNGVLGLITMLLESPLDTEQQELAESAHAACDSMMSGIDDIADFASLESGQLLVEPLPFDLRATAEEVVDHYSAQSARAGVELVLQFAPETPRRLIGDPIRVRQVLAGLVDNAVKYTSRGHVLVTVDAPVVTDGDALVRLTVADTGMGIPADRLTRIFNRLEPGAPGRTRRSGDPGLSLPAVKRLTELMDGTVMGTSRSGEGSTFTATLRLAHDAEVETKPARSPLDGVRAMVVDDVEIHRLVLRRQMGSLGMRVDTAPDGESALHLLREAAASSDPFRLALIDNVMPGMSGEALGRALRGDPRTAGLALMMFTATADRSEAKRFQQAGFDGFFLKPILPSMLQDALTAVLKARSGSRTEPIVTQQELDSRALESAAPLRAAAAMPAEPARVLLAEDNSINQKVAKRLLEKLGYRVDVASTGLEAVELWRRGTHEIVFMDCQMPEMDGYEAATTIRRHEAGGRRHTPIIALTASVLPTDREKCRASGMDDFLAKPIREGVVRMVIRRTLDRVKAEEQVQAA